MLAGVIYSTDDLAEWTSGYSAEEETTCTLVKEIEEVIMSYLFIIL